MADAPNPRSFKAARQQRKLDLEEVAEFTGISLNRLEDFENGIRQPSIRQVEALAHLYNVPIYLLYLDATPNLETVLPDFRRASPRPADLSPRGLIRLWSVEKVAEFAKQLLTAVASELPTFRVMPHRARLTDAYANELRAQYDAWFLERKTEMAISGPLEVQFLSGLRLFYESHLQISLVNEAPPNDYFGFYNEPSAGVPAIFVNRLISSKKAQLFTFVHELGHSLLREEGVSDPFKTSNSVEKACNRFAAEFLAPASAFSKLVESFGRTDRSETDTFVKRISQCTLLSQQATAVRLSELGYISSSDYSGWHTVWQTNPSREKQLEKEASGTGGPGALPNRSGSWAISRCICQRKLRN